MIVAVDGKDVTSVDRLRESIASHAPGDTVSVTIVSKDGKRSTKSVELAKVPDTATG
jgi:S1-C subfamily serine protease